MRPSWPGFLQATSIALTFMLLSLPTGAGRAQSVPDSDRSATDAATQAASQAAPTTMAADTVGNVATDVADSSGVALVDSAIMTPVLPDTVWALRLGGQVATLDSALSQRGRLLAEDIVAFARIRATSTTYWYEIFAGPVATRAEVDSLTAIIGQLGWYEILVSERTPQEDLLQGTVGQRRGSPRSDTGPGADPTRDAASRQ